MGLRPSCVKTAPRKVVAVRLFMITEQAIYICILSSAFDTSLDFFGRLLLKAGLALLGMQPTQAPLQGIISGRWSLMRKK